ncbi:helix-turn-helix transcriptional regulator [Roseicyclus sp.]|uniref:helix-turn-helix transcriptional regulator n=1 Tax=Roseicyclus sp. TaxID=1914329 RepID=UPI003FA0BD79
MDDGAYLDLLDMCYGAVDRPEHWAPFVEALTEALGAQAGDFVIEDYATGTARALGSTGFDPHFRETYDTHFLGENVWIRELEKLPRDRTHDDRAEPPGFEASAYYNEWVRPQGLRHAMGAILEREATWLVHIGFLRAPSVGCFDPGEIRLLDRLLPHLRRTLDVSQRLRRAEGAEALAAELLDRLPVAALIVDRGCRVRELNAAAERFLAARRELRSGPSGLDAWTPGAGSALRRLIRAACTLDAAATFAGPMAVRLPRRDEDGPPFLVEVLPLRAADALGGPARHCLVTVTDPARALAGGVPHLRRLWDLTPTEAELALALANGRTVEAFAAARGITPGTVRWHLKNAEAKMGVGSVAALVRHVHGALRGA